MLNYQRVIHWPESLGDLGMIPPRIRTIYGEVVGWGRDQIYPDLSMDDLDDTQLIGHFAMDTLW